MGERRIVMKFCTKCGRQLNDDDLFCPSCGAKQEVAQPASEAKQEEHRFNFEEARQEQVQAQKPVEAPKAKEVGEQASPFISNDKSVSAANSTFLMGAYIVLFIVYLILNTYVFNDNAILGKVGFLLGSMGFTTIFITRMTKSRNRKMEFLFYLHLVYIILMAGGVVGVFITLVNS